MSSPKLCIFCGQPGGNKEHIVPKWILKDLDLHKSKTKLGFGNQLKTGGMDEIMEPHPLGSFVTDSICANCNNGWMSQLENEVKQLLSPLMVDPIPSDERQLFDKLFLKSYVITRWLLKTACTFGTKMSCEVPDYLRVKLFQGQLHPEIMADISLNEECGLYVGMSRSWACYAGGKLDTMELPNESFRFVWQLRHLALRVAFFPGCQKMMSRPRYPVRLYPRFRVPPDITLEGVTKRAYRYATLEEVEHDTIYTPRHEHPDLP
jgi:hypothetical protein